MNPINTAPRNGRTIELRYDRPGSEWSKARFDARANKTGGWRFDDGGWLRETDENDRWMWRPAAPLPPLTDGSKAHPGETATPSRTEEG